MMNKIFLAAAVLLCASQVLGGPTKQVTQVGKVPRGLLEDTHAAVVAVENLVASANGLYAQVQSTYTVITVDVVNQVNDIVSKLVSLGIIQDDIDALVKQIDETFARVESIFTEQLTNIQNIISLLGDILNDISSVSIVSLIKDLNSLILAVEKLKADLSTVVDRLIGEAVDLQNSILSLIRGVVGEVATEIINALDGIYNTLMAEYNTVMASYNDVIASTDTAVAAIQQFLSHFSLRD